MDKLFAEDWKDPEKHCSRNKQTILDEIISHLNASSSLWLCQSPLAAFSPTGMFSSPWLGKQNVRVVARLLFMPAQSSLDDLLPAASIESSAALHQVWFKKPPSASHSSCSFPPPETACCGLSRVLISFSPYSCFCVWFILVHLRPLLEKERWVGGFKGS